MNYSDLSKKIHDICDNRGKIGSEEWDNYVNFHVGKKAVKLEDGVYMKMSEDCMCAYIFRTFPDQARCFVKVVPLFGYTSEEIEKMLHVQKWCCV